MGRGLAEHRGVDRTARINIQFWIVVARFNKSAK